MNHLSLLFIATIVAMTMLLNCTPPEKQKKVIIYERLENLIKQNISALPNFEQIDTIKSVNKRQWGLVIRSQLEKMEKINSLSKSEASAEIIKMQEMLIAFRSASGGEREPLRLDTVSPQYRRILTSDCKGCRDDGGPEGSCTNICRIENICCHAEEGNFSPSSDGTKCVANAGEFDEDYAHCNAIELICYAGCIFSQVPPLEIQPVPDKYKLDIKIPNHIKF